MKFVSEHNICLFWYLISFIPQFIQHCSLFKKQIISNDELRGNDSIDIWEFPKWESTQEELAEVMKFNN